MYLRFYDWDYFLSSIVRWTPALGCVDDFILVRVVVDLMKANNETSCADYETSEVACKIFRPGIITVTVLEGIGNLTVWSRDSLGQE